MTRSRKVNCGHSHDATAYYQPVFSPLDQSLDDGAKAALGEFAAELNSLPDPVDGAVAGLSTNDVAALLSRAPLDKRKAALHAVGLQVTPRVVGQALCQDVLARLERVHLHDVYHFARALTQPAFDYLATQAELNSAVENETGPEATEWSTNVLCFTLWAANLASQFGARLLSWAAAMPWFLPESMADMDYKQVIAAANAVIAATPDHIGNPTAAVASEAEVVSTMQEADDAISAIQGNETEVHAATDDGEGYSEAAPAGPAFVATSVDDEVIVSVDDEIRSERHMLNDALAGARNAAQCILAAVTNGESPDVADISALSSLRTSFLHLAQLLKLDSPANPTLTTIDATIAEREQEKRRSATYARLLSLCTLKGGAALSGPLSALHDLIGETLDHVTDADRRSDIDGLLAFADLIDLIATDGAANADTVRVMELQGRCSPVLPPPQLAQLLLAAVMGRLAWGRDEAGADDAGGPTVLLNRAAGDGEPAAVTYPAAACGQDPDQLAPAPGTTTEPPGPQPGVGAVIPAEATAESLITSAGQGAATDVDADAVIAELIAGRRFGLAAELTEQAGMAKSRQAALRLSALADAVRSEAGPCAIRLRAQLAEQDADLLGGDAVGLRLAVTALLRVALVTGDPTAGALLTSLSPRVERDLAVISDQVGRRALQGVLVGNSLRTVLTDVGDLAAQIEQARADARDMLRPRTLRFKRAGDVAREWLAGDGLLGSLLTAAETDDRKRAADVREEVLRLSAHGAINKDIDRLDAKYRASSGKPLQGSGRQDLVNLAEEALHRVSTWLERVSALEGLAQPGQEWATGELTEMRDAVLSRAADALAALRAQGGRGETVERAAALAAHDSLAVTVGLLDGTGTLPGREPPADLALTAELLKVPGATVEPTLGRVSAAEGTGTDAFTAAADRTWQEAFDAQVAAEEYQTAQYILAMAQAGFLGGAGSELRRDAADQLQVAEHRSEQDLRNIRSQLRSELQRARQRDEITEEQDGELTTLLESADPDAKPGGDGRQVQQYRRLSVMRQQLSEVSRLLPRYREEAAQRLRDRLEQLVRQSHKQVTVDEPRINRLIDGGDLATAEELIYYCEVGESVPQDTKRDDLERFFPAVPDALPNGITPGLIEAVRTGGAVTGCPVLDFSELSVDARATVAEALDAWRSLAVQVDRNNVSERAQLRPALRLAGFEFDVQTRGNRLDHVQKGRDRRFLELTNVSWNGNPIVPQFGSKLGGRLRVLLCWGQPAEDLLMSWVDQDPSANAILVAYLGTMSSAVRRRLAARAPSSDAPVVVIDDAALAYLAAHGYRQLDAAMSILLPFSAVQPYVRHKRSFVAREMFYGRDLERRNVIDPNATQIIFGGRGLGKTALLRSAREGFEREIERKAIHIELTTVDIGPGRQGADAVWDVLLRDLEGTVITLSKAERSSKRKHEIVRAGVRSWLEEDGRRQLLILLDESDGFFEVDSPQFAETNRLKDLGQMAGLEGRVKVVFAGLHSVQRFAKVSNNTFKHLAQRPTVIGPLQPQYAYDLIAKPMAALGYTFADEDLVNRILGYCSYQPYLLQMFGHRLVEHMHARRTPAKGVLPDGPPFTVTENDVAAVESDPELKADITSTFRDTLHLDPRYNVIANVLAYHAYEHGIDHRLTEVELRGECLSHWRDGFTGLDIEGFRAYLQEMTGLGVLAQNHDQRGWHLRSPNILRMIGGPHDVLAELTEAESANVPSEFMALVARRPLPDGTRAPLTAQQVDDLLGDHINQVRLVLGSRATRVDQVSSTIRAVCADMGARYRLLETRTRKQFEDELTVGKPGDRRVVLSDLGAIGTRDANCSAALATALERRPDAAGVTRSAVLVAGPEKMRFWLDTFAGGEKPGLGIVTLRRLDKRAMDVWAADTEYFIKPERKARLLEITGGWPYLTERAIALAEEFASADAALEALMRELSSEDAAADLVDAVGLSHDQDLSQAFGLIVDYTATHASQQDLLDAIRLSGHSEPEAALSCLEALALFDAEEDGTYSVEGLVARCWPYRRPINDE
jgi:hypothetical protein